MTVRVTQRVQLQEPGRFPLGLVVLKVWLSGPQPVTGQLLPAQPVAEAEMGEGGG